MDIFFLILGIFGIILSISILIYKSNKEKKYKKNCEKCFEKNSDKDKK